MAAVKVDTGVSMTDGTVVTLEVDFVIKASADGGEQASKSIRIVITICGSETLSAVESSTFTKTLDIGPSQSAFSIDLPAMFQTSDSYCPAYSYHIKTDNTALALATEPSADDTLNFYLSGTSLQLFPQTEKVHSFFVYAVSASGHQVTR
jgi:hypothetical protein